jgi:GT2 family glycosyltransferase
MTVSIIIVSYNTKELLLNCLKSIFRHDPKVEKEVIVVDNASTDGSPHAVKTLFPQVTVIENDQNLGFAAASNQGVHHASGAYVLLLNSDTKLKSDAISKLILNAQQQNASIATCQLQNSRGELQVPQGGALPNLTNIALWMLFIDDVPLVNRLVTPYQQNSKKYYLSSHPVGWVSGTALLVDRATYNRLGGLDQNLFMYGEDVEFCYRVHQAGLTIWYFAEPHLIHIQHASSSPVKALTGEYHGLLYLFTKHHPRWQLPLLRYFLATGAFLRLVLFGMIGGNESKKLAYQQAFDLARS